ncbi:MAG: NAD(P)-dependent oxidoreductase [Oscillatoriales cyanobacterium RM2_1_1]|nr:NAD(P)-dependent oxidoreductase [Oscillatoriales cyanobacterium SM2_3_0]NJO45284.1 NAD(P)-dependent oxidoreductase [Oscillatoriales cyanobacterium RM2_1_1]
MQKLLVTGASGFLGWNICDVAQSQWQVYGTYYAHNIKSSKGKLVQDFVQINLTDLPAVKDLFNTLKPDAVIHTAAQSKPNFCQLHPTETALINVTASVNLAKLCCELDIPCVFTSTDLVFDGLNPPYRETDPVSPISDYGVQKVLAEQKMRSHYSKTAICRMPLMFGVASPYAGSFIQAFMQTLRAGKDLSLY